ncbi:VWA domain-containing protein, partial [Myxococcota bacterium]|nr:VWA domain-containing protein [Myxococcota bacterium]
ADILTTALGCVLLLFMVAVLSMKKTLVDEQRARASAQAQLAETEAERRAAEEARQLAEARRLAAEEARQTEEALRLRALQTAQTQERLRDLMQSALAKEANEHDQTMVTLKKMNKELELLQEQLEKTKIELDVSQKYHKKFMEAQAQLNETQDALKLVKREHENSRTQYKQLLNVAESTIHNLDPRTASPVDIMLVIDGTSSMKPSLEATRRNLKATIGALRVVSPTARIGVVVFRDRKEAADFRIQSHPLTEDEASLSDFLSKIEAKSTRRDKDIPEWLCGGIAKGAKAKWRQGAIRLIVAVSDADAQQYKDCVKSAEAFREGGGRVHMISTQPPKLESSSTRAYYEREVLPQHEAIAVAGGGIHIRGADSDDLLKVVLRAAFSSRVEGGLDALREAVEGKKTAPEKK